MKSHNAINVRNIRYYCKLIFIREHHYSKNQLSLARCVLCCAVWLRRGARPATEMQRWKRDFSVADWSATAENRLPNVSRFRRCYCMQWVKIYCHF